VALTLPGTPDPFVKLQYESTVLQTKPAKKTLSPSWNETFSVCVSRSAVLGESRG
jgi:Ca2+-dependent lipid-binding protein